MFNYIDDQLHGLCEKSKYLGMLYLFYNLIQKMYVLEVAFSSPIVSKRFFIQKVVK